MGRDSKRRKRARKARNAEKRANSFAWTGAPIRRGYGLRFMARSRGGPGSVVLDFQFSGIPVPYRDPDDPDLAAKTDKIRRATRKLEAVA